MGSVGGGSSSSSKPLKPAQVQGYYNQLDANTGGRLADFALNGTQPTAYVGPGAAGQVTAASAAYTPADYGALLSRPQVGPVATAGANRINFNAQADPVNAALAAAPREVAYDALTPEQVQALGGLGALREAQASRAHSQTLAQYAADPGFSTFQRLRAGQLENQDYGATLDALNAEREAAITQFINEQRAQTLAADLANQAAVNEGSQFNAGQQSSADQFNVSSALAASGQNLQGALADQSTALQASLANAAAANAASAQQASLDSQFNALLGGLTSSEQDRILQTTLANQGAANAAGEFNATSAMTEAQRQYLANATNAGLSSQDMQALASIFFGGMGQTQSQSTPFLSGGDLATAGVLAATFL